MTALAFLESIANTTTLDSYLIFNLNLQEPQPVFAFRVPFGSSTTSVTVTEFKMAYLEVVTLNVHAGETGLLGDLSE